MDGKPPAGGGKAPRMAAAAPRPFPSRSLSRGSSCHATLAETRRASGSSSHLSACYLSVPPSSGSPLNRPSEIN